MKAGWSTFACGAVLGAAAGFVAGHLAVWSRVGSTEAANQWVISLDPSAPVTAFLPESALSGSEGIDGDGTVYFPDVPASVNGPVHALGSARKRETTRGNANRSEPATLPAITSAAPLADNHGGESQQVRSIVERELHDATQQERDVWSDVLRGLPEADAIGILRLWRTLGGRVPQPPDHSAIMPRSLPGELQHAVPLAPSGPPSEGGTRPD